ncbi:hypothetical protein COOONC_16865 [Cooperia oncophora]
MDPPPPDPTDPMDEPMDLDSMDQTEPTLNGVSNGYDHDHAAATEESSPPPAAHSPNDESSAPLDLSEEALLASDPELEDLDADRADGVTNELPVSIYKHIPDAGYMNTRFTRSLFPNFVIPEQAHRRPVPFIELQHLEDSVGFRYRSESTISDLYYEVYRDEDVREDEIVMALTRANGSCAMRFSEPAASQTDLSILCDNVRHVLPLHPEEGLVPLHVWKLDDSERAWLDDRAGEFENFRLHNEESKLPHVQGIQHGLLCFGSH